MIGRSNETHYTLLNVKEDSDASAIDLAYDRELRLAAADIDLINRIKKAYDILSDPRQRQEYDNNLAVQRSSPAPVFTSLPPSPRANVDDSSTEVQITSQEYEDDTNLAAQFVAEPPPLISSPPSPPHANVDDSVEIRGARLIIENIENDSELTLVLAYSDGMETRLPIENSEGVKYIEENKNYLDAKSLELYNNRVKTFAQEPGKILRGFFHPFFKGHETVSVEDEATRLLDTIKQLHEKWHYQKIYFTCSMNDEMAREIEKAYQAGERLTHAQEHYRNREAQLMMAVEKLLETRYYAELRPFYYADVRSFYIAPISICARPGGKGEITEDRTRSQLQTIQDALDQGHAVFCLTDRASWEAERPLSVTAEKLSIRKGDKNTFPPALNQLTQETLMGFQSDYSIPADILHHLKNDIEGVGPAKPAKPAKPESAIEKEKEADWLADYRMLKAALINPHLLNTWPLRLQSNERRIRADDTVLFEAITHRQKRAVIQGLIKEVVAREGKQPGDVKPNEGKLLFFAKEERSEDDPSLACQQLARKYAARVKTYLAFHPLSDKHLAKYQSADLAAELNRVKLAKVLLASLRKVYSPKGAHIENFDTQDFFDMVASVESYAVQLRGTHSKLQTILNDFAWEARLLEKMEFYKDKAEEPKKVYPQPLNIAVEDEYGIKIPPVASQQFMAVFRGADDKGKVALLKSYIAQQIDSIYNKDINVIGRMDHSKMQTAKRLKDIQTTDLHEYWMILEAEYAAQEEASSTTRGTIDEALQVLKNEFPPLSADKVRHFAFDHAVKLLKYINRRERSLAYKLQLRESYTVTHTKAHIQEAGELAHEMLKAKTLEELHSVILKASEYTRTLKKTTIGSGENKVKVDANQKYSSLIPVLETLEIDFRKAFRHRPLADRKYLNVIWQETFGGAYLDTKFMAKPKGKPSIQIKPEDRLQKRCYELAKERPQRDETKTYLAVRMCALINAMGTSKYPQKVGRSVRERVGVEILEKAQHQHPVVYNAQYFLAKLDEVETKRDKIKQQIEVDLKPFLSEGNHTLIELNDKIRKWIKDIKDARIKDKDYSRFFVSSNLQTFLEAFNKKLETTYPAVAAHARKEHRKERSKK